MHIFRSQNIKTRLELLIALNMTAAFLTAFLVIAFTDIMRIQWLFMAFASFCLLWLTFGTYMIRYRGMGTYEYRFNEDFVERVNLKNKTVDRLEYHNIITWRWLTDSYSPPRKRRLQIQLQNGLEWLIFQPPFSVKEMEAFELLAETLKRKIPQQEAARFS